MGDVATRTKLAVETFHGGSTPAVHQGSLQDPLVDPLQGLRSPLQMSADPSVKHEDVSSAQKVDAPGRPKVRRSVGTVRMTRRCYRNADNVFEPEAWQTEIIWHNLSSSTDVDYEDYFDLEVHEEVPDEDGQGYDTRVQTYEQWMAVHVLAEEGEAQEVTPKQKNRFEGYGVAYWTIRVMRYNPVFAISDAILHDTEIETGRKRSGLERATTAGMGVVDIISLGTAGKASNVAKAAYGINMAAGLAGDAGVIPQWTATFLQVSASLVSLGKLSEGGFKFLQKNGPTLQAELKAALKGMSGGEQIQDVMTVAVPLVDALLTTGVKHGDISVEAQTAVKDSLNAMKGILSLRNGAHSAMTPDG